MNPDSAKTPREEMEAWLTTLLLGELSEGEAAAVRELMKHDAELAKLHDRLRQSIALVRETVPQMEAPTAEPLKLSEEKRQRLLISFKIPPLKEEHRKPKGRFQVRLIEVLAVLAIVALLVAAILPNFVKARTSSQSNSVINNLRQLDGAKQQWALEHRKSNNDIPTFEDLKPYLKNDLGSSSVMGERYHLGSVGEPPTARAGSSGEKTWSLPGFEPGAHLASATPSPAKSEPQRGGGTVIFANRVAANASASSKPTPTKPGAAQSDVYSADIAGYVNKDLKESGRMESLSVRGLAVHSLDGERFASRFGSEEAADASAPPTATPPPPAQIVLPSVTASDTEEKIPIVYASEPAAVAFAVPVAAPVQLQSPPPAPPAAPPVVAGKPIENAGAVNGNFAYSLSTASVTNSISAGNFAFYESNADSSAWKLNQGVGGGAGGGGAGGGAEANLTTARNLTEWFPRPTSLRRSNFESDLTEWKVTPRMAPHSPVTP